MHIRISYIFNVLLSVFSIKVHKIHMKAPYLKKNLKMLVSSNRQLGMQQSKFMDSHQTPLPAKKKEKKSKEREGEKERKEEGKMGGWREESLTCTEAEWE